MQEIKILREEGPERGHGPRRYLVESDEKLAVGYRYGASEIHPTAPGPSPHPAPAADEGPDPEDGEDNIQAERPVSEPASAPGKDL